MFKFNTGNRGFMEWSNFLQSWYKSTVSAEIEGHLYSTSFSYKVSVRHYCVLASEFIGQF